MKEPKRITKTDHSFHWLTVAIGPFIKVRLVKYSEPTKTMDIQRIVSEEKKSLLEEFSSYPIAKLLQAKELLEIISEKEGDTSNEVEFVSMKSGGRPITIAFGVEPTKLQDVYQEVTQKRQTGESTSLNPSQIKEKEEKIPNVTPKATPEVTTKTTPKSTPKDTTKATPKDTTRDTTKDTPKVTKDTPKATPKVTTKATTKDTPKATPKVTPKNVPKPSQKNKEQEIEKPRMDQRRRIAITDLMIQDESEEDDWTSSLTASSLELAQKTPEQPIFTEQDAKPRTSDNITPKETPSNQIY